MSHLRIQPISEKGFTAEAVLDGDELAVRFAGTADLTVKTMMDSFLCQAHAEMCRGDLGATTVSVDISGLEFINSSCLMTVVTWITTVHEMAMDRYPISFHFKPSRNWQTRTVKVFEHLGQSFVSARSVDEPETTGGA
jgi:hypothetical protein